MPCGPTMRRNQKTTRPRPRCGPAGEGAFVFSRFPLLLGFLFDLHAIYPDNRRRRPGPQCLERAQASGNVQL